MNDEIDTNKNTNFRFNAIKHGILKESISEYESVDYEAILKQLEDEYKPRNLIETILLERIVLSYIKLFRISKAEKELLLQKFNPDEDWIKLKLCNEGYKPKLSSKEITTLDVYSRYETSAENRMYKAIAMLNNLRKDDFAKQN